MISARARTESRVVTIERIKRLREDEHCLKHTFLSRIADGEVHLAYKDVTLGRRCPWSGSMEHGNGGRQSPAVSTRLPSRKGTAE